MEPGVHLLGHPCIPIVKMDGVEATHNGLDSRRDFQFECTLRLTIYPSLAAGSMMSMSVLHIWVLLMPIHAWHDPHFRSLTRQLT